MLDLESRMEIFGVTVYRDLDDDKQFYYAAVPPHITRESGQPLFDLFTYSRGGEADTAVAGGFLNMTVDSGLAGLRGRIESELKTRFGDEIRLVGIPYSKGTARAIALGETSDAVQPDATPPTDANGQPLVAAGPRFIENILGSGRPSLLGDNRTIFSFSLSEDGAAFFLDVLGGDANSRPVGVVYELEYVGLLPAYDLEITIDFLQSYDYVRTRFNLATLFFKADVDNIVEKLKQDQKIRIREVSRTLELSTPEAIQQRESRIDRLVKELATGALFRASLTPGQPQVQGDTITAADPTETATTTEGNTGVRAAMRDGSGATIAAGMASQPGVRAAEEAMRSTGDAPDQPATPGTDPDQPTTSGGTGEPPRRSRTAADLWNRMGRPQAAFTLKQMSQEEQRTVTYNLSQVTAQKQTIVPQNVIQFMADSRRLNERVHLVNPNHPFFQRVNINVNAADVEFEEEGVRQMTVLLRYGSRPDGTSPKDTAEVILRTNSDSRDFTFFVDHRGTQSFSYKLIVDYQSDFGIGVDVLQMESPWIETETRSLAIHPRILGRVLPVELRLAPNVPEDVSEVHARVRYVNEDRNIDDSKLLILKRGEDAQTVSIRLADALEQFQLSATLYYSDGATEELPTMFLPDPNSGLAEGAVVLAPSGAGRLDGDIIVQDPVSELESVLVDVQVMQAADIIHSGTYELSTPGAVARTVFSVRLPQSDVPAVLRFKERRVFTDGGVEVDDWQEADSTNLLVGIPAADVKSVTLRYIGPPPSQLGVGLILVEMSYEDPSGDPEYSQQTTLQVDDNSATQLQTWKIRKADPEADVFRWRTTLYFNDGTTRESEYVSQSANVVVLHPQP